MIACASGESFWLVDVDKDGGEVATFDFKGELTPVPNRILRDDLLSLYTALPKSSLPRISELLSIMDSDEVKEAVIRSTMVMAVTALGAQHNTPNVICIDSPKAVFANQKYKKGELIIVPASTRIKFPSPDDNMHPVDSVLCTTHGGKSATFAAPLAPHQNPAWFLSSTDVEANVNMKVNMCDVEVSVKTGKSKSNSSKIQIPIFVNSRAVNSGDKLCFFFKKNKRPVDAD